MQLLIMVVDNVFSFIKYEGSLLACSNAHPIILAQIVIFQQTPLLPHRHSPKIGRLPWIRWPHWLRTRAIAYKTAAF